MRTHRTFSLGSFDPSLGVAAGSVFGLVVAICVAQSGSLFSADAWHDVTFIAGEVQDPRRNVPKALVIGCTVVVLLYFLINVIYLLVLPLSGIQNAPSDRVATAVLEKIIPGYGAVLMAIAIMISTFGCVNSLVLSGARAYYAMAHDRLFFSQAKKLNGAQVPEWSLWVQGIWSALLVLPRTFDPATGKYGNLKITRDGLRDFGRADFLYPDDCVLHCYCGTRDRPMNGRIVFQVIRWCPRCTF